MPSSPTYTRLSAAGIIMMQLLGIIGILCCGQVVYSQSVHYVPATLNQSRNICKADGQVLPRSSADIMQVALRLQLTNISATWIDLAISPSPWNWITDDEYTVHYDQGCYNFSSLHVARGNTTDINTCRESFDGYLYVGVQSTSKSHVSCVYTNETDVASAVSDNNCSSDCYGISDRQFCGNSRLDTFRLLSTRELSSLTMREVTSWVDNPGNDTISSVLCASLSIRMSPDAPSFISLVPQECTTKLPAICESENGTVTRMDSLVSWFGARQLCNKQDMKSVRVDSPKQFNILNANFQGEGWTALRGWTWRSQGREICDTVPFNWSAGYPDQSDGECIIVLKNGSWKNVQCDTEMPFLCETSMNTSSPAGCRLSIPSTSANTSYHTTMIDATPTSEQRNDTLSDPPTTTSSLTDVIHTTSFTDHITFYDDKASNTTSGLGVIGVAVGAALAFLVLAAVVGIVIVFMRKQASSGRSSPHTQRDPGDDKSLRPECNQSMDEFPIYARPNRDPPTDGVILAVENSLYGSVDPNDDELPSSRRIAPAIANAKRQGTMVYKLATASMGDELNDDSAYGQEAGGLSSSNTSMKDQIPDDDPLMIDNSLYSSTDSAVDGLPVS